MCECGCAPWDVSRCGVAFLARLVGLHIDGVGVVVSMGEGRLEGIGEGRWSRFTRFGGLGACSVGLVC